MIAPSSDTIPVPSPCINICKIDQQSGLCEGCWRTLDEIAAWGTASDVVKKAIWQKIHLRQSGSDTTSPTMIGK
jgi:predicted Fe-S protein YdhL (DUF1289 family)